MLKRFYCQNILPQCCIDGSEAHHIGAVMRIQNGDMIEIFDGKGTVATAEVVKVAKRQIQLEARDIQKIESRQNNRIILAVSVAKDTRFDWLIAKATELGVDHIYPTIYQRTVKQGMGKGIVGRYEKIAISSAKQCKRLHLPLIDEPAPFEVVFKDLSQRYNGGELIVSSLTQGSYRAIDYPTLHSDNDKIVFIGAEGGFTDDEELFLSDNSATAITLTDTILRTETAAMAIASLLAIARA